MKKCIFISFEKCFCTVFHQIEYIGSIEILCGFAQAALSGTVFLAYGQIPLITNTGPWRIFPVQVDKTVERAACVDLQSCLPMCGSVVELLSVQTRIRNPIGSSVHTIKFFCPV
jgi:hypothetical protein